MEFIDERAVCEKYGTTIDEFRSQKKIPVGLAMKLKRGWEKLERKARTKLACLQYVFELPFAYVQAVSKQASIWEGLVHKYGYAALRQWPRVPKSKQFRQPTNVWYCCSPSEPRYFRPQQSSRDTCSSLKMLIVLRGCECGSKIPISRINHFQIIYSFILIST